jgi:hypothetical protein
VNFSIAAAGDGDAVAGLALLFVPVVEFAMAVEFELLLLDELPEPQADKMEMALSSPATTT